MDLAPYLEQPNPYANDTTWSELIEEDGYLAQVERGTTTIPNISYDTNYLVVFYDKRAMKELGLEVPNTWEEFLNCLSVAQKDKDFPYPLGLSVNTQSATKNFLGWVIQMYLDQYFRDFTDAAHSKEGDYSYSSRVDGKYEYSTDNLLLGSSESYTFNLNRIVDSFFNNADYAPDSDRYENLMRNLYDLMEYIDPAASNQDMFDRFNRTVIHYNSGTYTNLNLFSINRLDYVSTYRTAFAKQSADGTTIYPTPAEIDETIGWFALPAMSSNPSMNGKGAPEANNVRSLGGAESMFGILNSNNQEYTDLAIDFLMYLYSPAGQNVRYARLKDLGAPVVMNQLVKNVTIDDSINLSDNVTFTGNCNLNPYLRVGYGYGLDTINIGNTGNKLQTSIATAVSNYLTGSTKEWSATGKTIFDYIKNSFANYAKDQNLIYDDYTKVASATSNFTRSPFANA